MVLLISPLPLAVTLAENIAHISVSFLTQQRRTGRWQIVSSSRCCFTSGFVRSRQTSLPVADWEAISLLAPAPFLLWLLSPQSLQALSQRRPQPVDPSIWVQSSGRRGGGWWSGGGMKGRRDRGRVVLHWGTAASLKPSPSASQPQWKSEVRVGEIGKNGTGRTGWRLECEDGRREIWGRPNKTYFRVFWPDKGEVWKDLGLEAKAKTFSSEQQQQTWGNVAFMVQL